jgi:diphthamide biosynthesis protein 2
MNSAFSTCSDDIFSTECVTNIRNPTASSDLESVYDLQRCVNWLNEVKVSKVCLQFPDENLVDSVAVSRWLNEHTNSSFYILGDTSYGSCCCDIVAADHIPADALIHFGPACLSHSTVKNLQLTIPVLYVFPKPNDLDFNNIVNNINEACLESKYLLIISSCECSHIQSKICAALEEKSPGRIVVNSKLLTGEYSENASASSRGLCSAHCKLNKKETHQMLCLGRGFCLPDGVGIECFDTVYIGEENVFLHCLLTSLVATSRSLKYFSPEGNSFGLKLDVERMRRRQRYLVQQIREATRIGLVLASPGDPSLLLAVKHIRHLITSRNPPPRLYSLAIGKPNPAKLSNFPEMDVFVLLACAHHPLLAPATSQQLGKDYYKPIVGMSEVELAYNAGRSTAGIDFHSLLPGGCEYQDQVPSEDQISNISLLTGRALNIGASSTCEEQQGTVSERIHGQLIEPASAGLLGRTWQGLDPALGQHTPVLATQGRSGIAAHYESEPANK